MSVPHTVRPGSRAQTRAGSPSQGWADTGSRSEPPTLTRHSGGALRWLPQTLAILLLIGGVAGYVAGTTAVRLVDDGAARTVRTYASTVKGLLHHTGTQLGAHDRITPAVHTRIAPDTTVVVERGRPVTLTLDGVTKRRWVTERTVGDLVATLGLGDRKRKLSASPQTVIGRNGMALTVRTEKRLTLHHDGQRKPVTTYAATSRELLGEQGLALKGRDEVKPAIDATLAGAKEVRVVRVTVKPKRETVALKPPTKAEKNDEWMVDQELVVEAGTVGKADQQVEYIYRDGKYAERKVITSKTLVEPEPRVVRKGTKPYPEDDTGLNWAALAQCESGGNPRAVSSGGTYHGLYQFNVDMWQRMGGIGLPSQATPREQTYRAIRLYKRAGADQWPHCGPRLFS